MPHFHSLLHLSLLLLSYPPLIFSVTPSDWSVYTEVTSHVSEYNVLTSSDIDGNGVDDFAGIDSGGGAADYFLDIKNDGGSKSLGG
jgi:hypothetical protein